MRRFLTVYRDRPVLKHFYRLNLKTFMRFLAVKTVKTLIKLVTSCHGLLKNA
jgi:hypothetical protein